MSVSHTAVVAVDGEVSTDDEVTTADDGFTAFYRSHRDRLARALALTLRDGHLAAEAIDEAMARAFQRWSRVESYDDPAAWVYRVALNWSTSVIRRRLRPPRVQHVPDLEGVGSIAEPTVLAALAALDLDQRAVIVCRYYLGLSEAETAAALRIRPGTVKSRSHRGLRILESRLSHLRPEASA
jgi:RNA polymerase sigma factor (sigma-70 family)